jgi:hypothetical protein
VAKICNTEPRFTISVLEQAIRAHAWVHDDPGALPNPQPPLPVFVEISDETEQAILERLLPCPTSVSSMYDVRCLLARMIVHDGLGLDFSPGVDPGEYRRVDGSCIYSEEQAIRMASMIAQTAAEGLFSQLGPMAVGLWNELWLL